MPSIVQRCTLLAATLLFGVTMVCAQESQPQGQSQYPQAAGTTQQGNGQATPASQPSANQPYANGQQAPNTAATTPAPSSAQPLTGAEEFTLSQMGASHSYFAPSLQFGQSVITTGTSTFSTSNLESLSTIGGVFALHHLWHRYEFTATYAGVGLLYNRHPALNTSAHTLTISQRIDGKRSSLLLTDFVTYLPESGYGYARFGALDTPGGTSYGYGGLYSGNTAGLDTPFLPGQSILTGTSSQVGNSTVAQYDYLTSPLSSLTVMGSYVTLLFPNSQHINYNSAIVRIGYDRSISPNNSIGLFYQADIVRFGSLGGNFTNHEVSLVYRRTISNRLGLELGAGPQVNVFNNSQAQHSTQFSWQGQARLTYQLERLSLELDYFHYTSGGSGVYQGARTDTVAMQTSVPFSRMWAASMSLGYAYNTNLQTALTSASALSYNSWYGTINLQHTLNRWMSLFVGYNLRQQISSQATCIGVGCGTFYAQQYLTFGINWHPLSTGVE